MAATMLAPLVLLLMAAPGGGPPPAGAGEEPVVPGPGAASPPAAAGDDGKGTIDATAALRATQDLEAKLIELRREVDSLERQRAAWGDVRRGLEDLSVRVDQLSHRLDEASERPPAPPAAPPPPEATGWGLRLRSRGGVTSLRPSVRLQVGYEGELVERGPAQRAPLDRSGFILRHAELMLEGQVLQPRFEYRLLVDFAAPVIVKDAFLQWRATPSLAVRLGRFKLPFGFQRYLRSTTYDFVDLSETMTAFSLERDVGGMVVGRPLGGRVQYQLAVTNGAGNGAYGAGGLDASGRGASGPGASGSNDNLDLAYTVRIVAAPWGALPESEGDLVGQLRPLVSFGAAAHYNLVPTDVVARTNDPAANVDIDGNGRIDNVAVWQGGLELRAHFRGAALQAEIFRRLEHPGVAAADRRSGGQYAQASCLVIPHVLGIAVRIERTDLPLYGVPLMVRQLEGTRIDAQTLGVNAFLRGHDLKLQVEYSHLRTAGVVTPTGVYSPDSHRLRAGAQLMF